MAVILPVEFELQREGNQKAGGRIQEGDATFIETGDDLTTLNQRIAKCFADNTRDILGHGGDRNGIDESANAVFAARYHGAFKMWSENQFNVQLYAFAQNVDIELVIDGNSILTLVCGGALAWYTSAVVDLSTTAVTVAAFQVVTINARRNTAAAVPRQHLYVVLGESNILTAAALPDENPATTYQQTDDGGFAAGVSVDRVAGKRLQRNIFGTLTARTRGTGIWHRNGSLDLTNAFQVSSVAHRADGPYALEVSPWCSTIDVVVSCEAINDGVINHDVTLFAWVEGEDEEVARARAVVVSPGSVENVHFTGLKVQHRNAYGWARNNVYVGYVSEISSAAVVGGPVTIIAREDTGKYTVDISGGKPEFSAFVPGTFGRAFKIFATLGANRTAGGKPAFTNLEHSQFYDLVTSEDEEVIRLSPNPDLMQLPRIDWFIVGGFQGTLFATGTLKLYGVWLNEVADPYYADADRGFDAGVLPPAGLIRQVHREQNNAARLGAAQIATRHAGQQWTVIRDFVTQQNLQEGRYRFMSSEDDFFDVAVWPLTRDPNQSGAFPDGSLRVDKIFAQCQVLAVRQFRAPTDEVVSPTWRLIVTVDPQHDPLDVGTIASGAQIQQSIPVLWDGDTRKNYSHFDAERSATLAPTRDSSVSLGDDYEHDYTIQAAWMSEAMREGLWSLSPRVEVPSQTIGYPMFLKLQMRSIVSPPNSKSDWVIVTGAHSWYGPRI